MTKGDYQFGKQQKLKRRKLIEQLFAEGKAVSAHPLRLIYTCPSDKMDTSVKAGVSVSSRNFKKAVHRNRIKRLLREAFRLNKAAIIDHAERTNQEFVFFIIYTDKVLPEFSLIKQKMPVILNKLIKATTGEAPSTNS